MFRNINRLIDDKCVVSVFTDRDDKSKCSVGFIMGHDDLGVLLQCIDLNGEDDGLAWRFKNDIYRIDIEGNYETRLKKLFYLKKQKIRKDLIDFSGTDLFNEILKYAMVNKKVIELLIDNYNRENLIVGLVKSFDENTLTINNLNDNGEDDGLSIVNLDEVINVNIDSKDGRDIMLLKNNS